MKLSSGLIRSLVAVTLGVVALTICPNDFSSLAGCGIGLLQALPELLSTHPMWSFTVSLVVMLPQTEAAPLDRPPRIFV